MTPGKTLLDTLAKNPISAFAVLCVAATGTFLGWLTYRIVVVLESSGYCANSIQAERITPGNTFVGLTGCIDILKLQLGALATGFHIAVGGFVFGLVVLVVVVVAGARASGKLPGGMEFDVSRDAAAGAEHVREAAEIAEAEVKGTA